MSNLNHDTEPRDFWVWVSPHDIQVRHQVVEVGSFFSFDLPGLPGEPSEIFPLIHNPRFMRAVSPFQGNLLWGYHVEYNLELSREAWFHEHPSRMLAVFLLDSEAEARRYANRHHRHVADRVLERVFTDGAYTYSRHDSSWVDLLRVHGNQDAEFLNPVTKAYWSGELVKDNTLMAAGLPWTADPLIRGPLLGNREVLRPDALK